MVRLGGATCHLEAEEVGGPIEHRLERRVYIRHVEEDGGGVGVRLAARGDGVVLEREGVLVRLLGLRLRHRRRVRVAPDLLELGRVLQGEVRVEMADLRRVEAGIARGASAARARASRARRRSAHELIRARGL